MKRYIILCVIAIVSLSIGYFVGNGVCMKSHEKQISEIRSAWYKACIEEEEVCAELYAKGYLLEQDHNNPTFASIWTQGLQLGTAHTLEAMNQVAIAFGENPIVLSDVNTIRQRIENIATDMIKSGKVSNE